MLHKHDTISLNPAIMRRRLVVEDFLSDEHVNFKPSTEKNTHTRLHNAVSLRTEGIGKLEVTLQLVRARFLVHMCVNDDDTARFHRGGFETIDTL